MKNRELAHRITEDIFNLGSEPYKECSRIKFMGGAEIENEIDLGGLNEGAFFNAVLESLNRHLTKEGTI